MNIPDLEVDEIIDKVAFLNEEPTIILIVYEGDLSLVSCSPNRISIIPRTSKLIQVPWVPDVIKSDNLLTCSILDYVCSQYCVCVTAWKTLHT
jgi:hypothetical protein